MRRKLWGLVVRMAGGFYERGVWSMVVHDRGVYIAKRRVVRWEWML